MEFIAGVIVFILLLPFFAVAYPVGKWANRKWRSSSRIARWSKRLVDYTERSSNFLLNFFQYQTIWRWINPRITTEARLLFEQGNYRFAVLAAMVEVNSQVKKIVKERTGQELDGAKLMDTAFSLHNPVIRLEDLENETGRNIQAGYLNLFKGALQALRNPSAHEKIILSKEKAMRYLVLTSLLMDAIDDAPET